MSMLLFDGPRSLVFLRLYTLGVVVIGGLIILVGFLIQG